MSGLAQAFLMLSECQAGVPWMCHTILVSKNEKIVLLRKGLQGAGPWGHALDAEAGSGLAASVCHFLPPALTPGSLAHGKSPDPSFMGRLCEVHGQVRVQGHRT